MSLLLRFSACCQYFQYSLILDHVLFGFQTHAEGLLEVLDLLRRGLLRVLVLLLDLLARLRLGLLGAAEGNDGAGECSPGGPIGLSHSCLASLSFLNTSTGFICRVLRRGLAEDLLDELEAAPRGHVVDLDNQRCHVSHCHIRRRKVIK
jgi:hypothetical protein